jgi:hypothetical protein
MDSDHCEIVAKSLRGEKTPDEQTFASLAILADRLERVKKVSPCLSEVAFSQAAKELAKQKSEITVC